MPDGRLGLLDYGQTKHISEDARRGLARLIVALDEDRRDEIVQIMIDHGARTKYAFRCDNYFLYVKIFFVLFVYVCVFFFKKKTLIIQIYIHFFKNQPKQFVFFCFGC